MNAALLTTLLMTVTATSGLARPAITAPSANEIVFTDDFSHGMSHWKSELEKGGMVEARDQHLEIDVPAGASIWLTQPLSGPLMIQYRVTAISAGGKNDRVSDVNCFWMATDSRNPHDFFAVPRSGAFPDYNQLLTYYAGYGGNDNTTTRFRRYIGSATTRPLRAEDDRRDRLVPNRDMLIQLIADGQRIQYFRDGQMLFEMNDSQPYTQGYFAFRTVNSHLRISDFVVYSLKKHSN